MCLYINQCFIRKKQIEKMCSIDRHDDPFLRSKEISNLGLLYYQVYDYNVREGLYVQQIIDLCRCITVFYANVPNTRISNEGESGF